MISVWLLRKLKKRKENTRKTEIRRSFDFRMFDFIFIFKNGTFLAEEYQVVKIVSVWF